jgi:NAD(P)-dependent dehydrogenase (short-subunit alcohol dehydrogenase family)
MDLHGKVALVTGGAVRVGKAIVLGLADAGSDIVLNYHSSVQEALHTSAEVQARGRQVLPVQADVAQADQVEQMLQAAIARFGRVDVLVNSASAWQRTPWKEVDEDAWDRSLDIDLKGAFLCARSAALHLAAHGDGAIVNIVDLSAFVPFPNMLPHSVAKAGLLSMTYALAMELAPEIRVNAVAPGPVLPPPDVDEGLMDAIARRTLLGRWGSPRDVAGAVVFLVQSEYITGAVLPVDGGERLRGRGAARR